MFPATVAYSNNSYDIRIVSTRWIIWGKLKLWRELMCLTRTADFASLAFVEQQTKNCECTLRMRWQNAASESLTSVYRAVYRVCTAFNEVGYRSTLYGVEPLYCLQQINKTMKIYRQRTHTSDKLVYNINFQADHWRPWQRHTRDDDVWTEVKVSSWYNNSDYRWSTDQYQRPAEPVDLSVDVQRQRRPDARSLDPHTGPLPVHERTGNVSTVRTRLLLRSGAGERVGNDARQVVQTQGRLHAGPAADCQRTTDYLQLSAACLYSR